MSNDGSSDDVTIREYERPPADFDVCSASERDLRAHGFSARVTDSTDLARQLRAAYSRAKTFLQPGLTMTDRRRTVPDVQERGPFNDTASTWTGFVAEEHADPNFVGYNWVLGSWVVPNVHVPRGGSGQFHASQWVGIDGYHDFDPSRLFQAGTETAIDLSPAGVITRHTYAWWEWLPENEVVLNNLDVAPGDVMWVYLDRHARGQHFTVHMGNLSSGVFLLPFTPVPTVRQDTPFGYSAEWIVENPDFSNLNQLANFERVYFDSCSAGGELLIGHGPSPLIGLDESTRVTMIDQARNVMAWTSKVSPNLMTVTWERAT